MGNKSNRSKKKERIENKQPIKEEKEEKENKKIVNLNEQNEMNLNIHFLKDIIIDSIHCSSWIYNTFCIFKDINNILFLVYANYNNSIISYNLIDEKKVNEIKRAHKSSITNFRFYLDKNNNRDLLISISGDDLNIKLWNFNNFECLLNLRNKYSCGWIYSSFIFNIENNIVIITSNCNYEGNKVGPIKLFDLSGKNIKK